MNGPPVRPAARLGRRLLLWGGLTNGLAGIGLLAAFASSQWHAFSVLEQRDLHQQAQRIEAALSDRLDRLRTSFNDWSNWDSSHRWLSGHDPGFSADNLSVSTLETLGLRAMAWFDLPRPVRLGRPAGP